MARFVALLRAVNVGGTGLLAMTDLRAICEAIGCRDVRTYIASGNVVFEAQWGEAEAKARLGAGLQAHAGAPVRVLVRSAAEIAAVVSDNPFLDTPGHHVVAIFLDDATSPAMLEGVTGCGDEEALRLGRREIYVRYGSGQAGSRLRIPAARLGTARNMNTVARLAAMAR